MGGLLETEQLGLGARWGHRRTEEVLRQEGVPGGSDGCFLKPLQKLRRKLVRGCNFLLSSSANFEFLLISRSAGCQRCWCVLPRSGWPAAWSYSRVVGSALSYICCKTISVLLDISKTGGPLVSKTQKKKFGWATNRGDHVHLHSNLDACKIGRRRKKKWLACLLANWILAGAKRGAQSATKPP